jgi:hypothetical protein
VKSEYVYSPAGCCAVRVTAPVTLSTFAALPL